VGVYLYGGAELCSFKQRGTTEGDLGEACRIHSPRSEGRASTSEGESSRTRQERGKPSLWAKMTDRLPDYLASGLVDSRAWKTFARCMAAMFGALVLLLVQTCESRCVTFTSPALEDQGYGWRMIGEAHQQQRK
jgi:hypothetical protein